MLRGVARLLAVADLTVKTNIRTARRGTLRAATTSSTMQADHRAWFACKIPSGSRTYVSNAKLDKNAGNSPPPAVRSHSDACVRAIWRFLKNHRLFGKDQTTAAWGQDRHPRPFCSTASSFFPAEGPLSMDRLFWRRRRSGGARCSGPGRDGWIASGKGGISSGASLLAVELELAGGAVLGGRGRVAAEETEESAAARAR